MQIFESSSDEINFNDAFFETSKSDYPNFDTWTIKCSNEKRKTWHVKDNQGLCALIMLKEETFLTSQVNGHLLKICLFKVSSEHRKIGLGSELLSLAIEYAKKRDADWVYATLFEKYEDMLTFFLAKGFSVLNQRNERNEILVVKKL